MTGSRLDIAITTWNSEAFIDIALTAIARVCGPWNPRVVIFDNGSTDNTLRVARAHGVHILSGRMSQADALNVLAQQVRGDACLLMHADVVLLDTDAFAACMARLEQGAALVSPEDIGCGPWTRPFGRGMPESSFMLFRAKALIDLREWHWFPWRWNIRWPRRVIDFYGPHITHHLPQALTKRGLSWCPLEVHPSPREAEPWFVPDWSPPVWREDLGYLRYGLGNFYSIEGRLSHYHNWYERVYDERVADPRATTGGAGQGFPLSFVREASKRFIADYRANRLVLPRDLSARSEPVAL